MSMDPPRHAVALAQCWGSHVVGVHVVFAGVTFAVSYPEET
jgi:hypothetical protein